MGGFIQVLEDDGVCWVGTVVAAPGVTGATPVTDSKWSSLADGDTSPAATYNLSVNRDYPGVCSSGSPASGGRTEMSDFEIVKYPDQMTPKFFQKCVTGATVKRIILEFDTPNGMMVYVLSDNNISSHTVKGPQRFAANQLETIKVIYTKIEVIAPDGGTYHWNVQTNSNSKLAVDTCKPMLDTNRRTRVYKFG